MIRLVRDAAVFLDTGGTKSHIAYPLGLGHWITACGLQRSLFRTKALKVRELSDDDPDSFVCGKCKRNTTRGTVPTAQEIIVRAKGDHVFVVADNYGSAATIIDTRESIADVAPVSRYKVRTDSGDEFWAFDFEIQELDNGQV